jgi:hypothetical protein
MATVIGFSANTDDYLLVNESAEEIRRLLLPAALPADGLCQLTKIPKMHEPRVAPVPVYVNPARIAYLHPQ